MKTKFIVIIFFMISFFKAQTTCNYVEENPNSKGYSCEENILFFTSSVDTEVKGSISAINEIFITPAQGYSILVLPTETCVDCAEGDTGGIVVKPPKSGNGGKDRMKKSNSSTAKRQEITIEKNPVDNILKLSINKGLIKAVKIYNAGGQEVLSKNNNADEIEIDVSRFPKGTYWVKTITNDNQIYTKQFIKK